MVKNNLPVLEIFGDLHVKKDLIAFATKGLPINILVHGKIHYPTSLKPKCGLAIDYLEVQGDVIAEDIILNEKTSLLLK